MLEMNTGVIKLLRLDYCLHITISIIRILVALFAVVYIFIPHKHAIHYNF